ncbi:BglII/BstYI family type II restriction endonuclease [Parvibaculum sp.]|uniref:BglII/BstYI family type II restriction endonuclease n=1 Tax=Parvibaculum sp. TaxID=2024848 RepID=UPI00391D2FDD
MFDNLRARGFQIEFHSHAWAILSVDFPEAMKELSVALQGLTIPIDEIIRSGGGEAKGTQRLRRTLSELGWKKANFEIRKTINKVERESISHEIDHVRYFPDGKAVALEIEWNNKDPFFDRDLENFKRLHAEGAISVGAIVTRGASLQDRMKEFVARYAGLNRVESFEDLRRLGLNPTNRQEESVLRRVDRDKNPVTFRDAWADQFVSDKFGAATTHWRKLEDRVHRGVGNPCPLLLIGLPDTIVAFD